MAKGMAAEAYGHSSTICLPVGEEEYQRIVEFAASFRRFLDQSFQEIPELFPEAFSKGYELKDARRSAKSGIKIRRIELRDGTSYSIRPSFVMPYHAAPTRDVEIALFLRKFAVPYWALAHVFGRNPMYWYRLEFGLGRNSIVGTTVRRADMPEHLLADEHHQPRNGEKNYIATTVAAGCCLGAAVAESSGAESLAAAYEVFRQEVRNVEPDYEPKTVNTDGWHGTQAAWKSLFPQIIIVQCFLHAWLKIRERMRNAKDCLAEVSQRVWEAYHALDRATFSRRIAAILPWAKQRFSGIVLEKIVDLCGKRDKWMIAYEHPGSHRTSNMLDRVMRSMNRYFDSGQHLHGSLDPSQRHCRSWALLHNFAPWSPAATKANGGWTSPAERLNQHRYHENWLHNLLVSASLGGSRIRGPQKT